MSNIVEWPDTVPVDPKYLNPVNDLVASALIDAAQRVGSDKKRLVKEMEKWLNKNYASLIIPA